MNDFDFIANLAGVANRTAEETVDLLNSSDKELLQAIRTELKGMQFQPTAKVEARLKELETQLREIRDRAFQKAATQAEESAVGVGKASTSHAAGALSEQSGKTFQTVSDAAVEQLAKRQPFEGKTIQQWFSALEDADMDRIMQKVRQGLAQGTTVESIIRTIRGTKENGYSDGVLQTTRRSAVTIARTTINGIANNSRLRTFVENADVIDGLKFVATLDSRTSKICAFYDGKIWKKDEWGSVVVPPLHPNCRSTLVAWIEGVDDIGERPAERENFEELAKERYEQNTGKKWNDLADTTRQNYRYKEMSRYKKETGKSPYRQVSAQENFREYFAKQPADFQRAWLGTTRYQAYKDGSLSLDDLVSPDTGYSRTITDLRDAGKIPTPPPQSVDMQDESESKSKSLDAAVMKTEEEPAETSFTPMTEKEHKNAAKDAAKTLTKSEREAVQIYSGGMHMIINGSLRGTVPEVSEQIEKYITNIKKSLDKLTLADDTQLYRGVLDVGTIGVTNETKPGDIARFEGFVSTSTDRNQAFAGTKLIINAKNGTHAIPMANGKLSFSPEQMEVLLNHDTRAVIKSIVKDSAGHILEMEMDIL